MNAYIGHDTQYYGVEEHRLVGGKGDGMRLYEINNGKGMELSISLDRCGDIIRLKHKGINLSYMSPCGYVAPSYYDCVDDHWLESFTAGFLTTCGLENVGNVSQEDNKVFSLHGHIGNQPCEHTYWRETDTHIIVHTLVKDERIFARKLRLEREIVISKESNEFEIHDTIINMGDNVEPIMILYHMNMGFPLLDEDSIITIPSGEVIPRNEHAKNDIVNWMKMQKPTPGYVERCYYHKFNDKNGTACIYQPKINTCLTISFDAEELDAFIEWKMMGIRDYALGLECGNCYPDGRHIMREKGMLKFLQPGASKDYLVKIRLEDR